MMTFYTTGYDMHLPMFEYQTIADTNTARYVENAGCGGTGRETEKTG